MTRMRRPPLHASPVVVAKPAGRALSPRIAALVAGLALAGASVQAQAPPPGETAASSREAAGAGRGGDSLRQTVNAANQQADAAFQRADRNGDGRLSRSEADHLPAIAARFEQLDVNRDQSISRDEFNRVLAD